MTDLFPKWTNKLPAALALGAAASGLFVVVVVHYWFSPKHTDVGYQPYQPVEYSHRFHAGDRGMDCRYCHRLVEEGPHATIPDTETCLGCHNQLQAVKDSPLLKPLFAAASAGKAIPWVKVHLLPEYAYFHHGVHVNAGVGCASCHGRVDQMDIVRQVEPLSMGWCLECHRDPTPHLRPKGVSVTDMAWVPDEQSRAAARKRLEFSGDTVPELNPPTHCSACHR